MTLIVTGLNERIESTIIQTGRHVGKVFLKIITHAAKIFMYYINHLFVRGDKNV